jgi:hypothetical protein
MGEFSIPKNQGPFLTIIRWVCPGSNLIEGNMGILSEKVNKIRMRIQQAAPMKAAVRIPIIHRDLMVLTLGKEIWRKCYACRPL